MDLSIQVAVALDQAVENGYVLQVWTDDEIAADLIRFSAAFETCEPADILPAIRSWRDRENR